MVGNKNVDSELTLKRMKGKGGRQCEDGKLKTAHESIKSFLFALIIYLLLEVAFQLVPLENIEAEM